MAEEYRMLKKLRRKEITEAEFDAATEKLDAAHEDTSMVKKKKNKKKGGRGGGQ